MAPSNTMSYHVSGPVVLQLNTTPLTVATWVNVGVCEDGIDLEFRPFFSEIKSDGGGGPSGDAVEFIFLNWSVLARCTLVPFAGNYTNIARRFGQATTTEGTMVTPGTLYGLNGFLPGVRFASADVDGGWQLTRCMVTRPGSAKWSTRETKPQFEFRAINNFDPGSFTSINANVLYVRI